MRLSRKVLETQEVKKDISAQRRGYAKAQEHELMVFIKNSEHGVHAKGRRRGNLKLHLTPENHVRHNTKGRFPTTGHRTLLGQWVWMVASQRTRCTCPLATSS